MNKDNKHIFNQFTINQLTHTIKPKLYSFEKRLPSQLQINKMKEHPLSQSHRSVTLDCSHRNRAG